MFVHLSRQTVVSVICFGNEISSSNLSLVQDCLEFVVLC